MCNSHFTDYHVLHTNKKSQICSNQCWTELTRAAENYSGLSQTAWLQAACVGAGAAYEMLGEWLFFVRTWSHLGLILYLESQAFIRRFKKVPTVWFDFKPKKYSVLHHYSSSTASVSSPSQQSGKGILCKLSCACWKAPANILELCPRGTASQHSRSCWTTQGENN